MKNRFFTVVLLSVACILSARSVSAAVRVVQDGVARAAIYVAPTVMAADLKVASNASFAQKEAEMQRRRLRESVNDLALYVKKMSGAQIEVFQRAPLAGEKTIPILIGEYATHMFGAPAKTSPFKQGFRVIVSKQGIGLTGQSDEAASYAIYELLDQLGCRWFMPSEMGESIPALKSITLRERDISAIPATEYRGIWYADDAFKRRNRLGGFPIQASHALESYITKEQREEHPDWRAVIDGKPHEYRLKWSNPEVSVAVADAIIAKLDKTQQPSISLSPADGSSFDESDDTKWDTGDWDPANNQVSITDRYVRFCNLVAERVARKYPHVRLGLLAYVQYTRPPLREKLHPNLVPQIAPITYCRSHAMTDMHICPSRPQIRQIVEGWGKASRQISYYNYMFHLAEVSVPYPMLHQMKAELPIIYANKVAFWQPETLANFESSLPGIWLSLRKAWDPGVNSDAILDEFFSRFYLSAEKPMRQYWQIFDDAWTNSPEHAGMDAGYIRRFTPKVMVRARAAMNAAIKAASTPIVRQRVKMQDDALKQFELLMQMKWNLNSGRLTDLDVLSKRWETAQAQLGEEYSAQYAFSKIPWKATRNTLAGHYYNILFGQPYAAGGKIARDFKVFSPPLRSWKYAVDKDKSGEANNWHKPEFNDVAWKTTDVGIDTWMALGLESYFGSVWYRTSVDVPAIPEEKKIFLWTPSEDGDLKVFVNGIPIPYRNAKGESSGQFKGGLGTPVSFDITAAVKRNHKNEIAIVGTRSFFNELGTGGLMASAYLYAEK